VPDDGAVTSTRIFKAVTQTFPFTNPCSGSRGTATMTFSGVMQVTYQTSGPSSGTFRVSGNEIGTSVLTPTDPAQPSYNGQFTRQFATTITPDTGIATTTLNIHGVGSDGSQLNFQLVQHMAMSATRVIVSFDHPSCG
jgi:hypothetical protein